MIQFDIQSIGRNHHTSSILHKHEGTIQTLEYVISLLKEDDLIRIIQHLLVEVSLKVSIRTDGFIGSIGILNLSTELLNLFDIDTTSRSTNGLTINNDSRLSGCVGTGEGTGKIPFVFIKVAICTQGGVESHSDGRVPLRVEVDIGREVNPKSVVIPKHILHKGSPRCIRTQENLFQLHFCTIGILLIEDFEGCQFTRDSNIIGNDIDQRVLGNRNTLLCHSNLTEEACDQN